MTKKETRPGPGRPPSLEDPQRTICDAAATLFAEKGYDGASLQDVAQAVGVTKAGLYHYFQSKQALYEAIVLATLNDLRRTAEAAIAAAPGHHDKLVAFMSSHGGFVDHRRDRYRASFFGRSGGDMAGYTAEQLAARKSYVRLLETLLEDGVRDGAFRVEDVPTFARGVLGMLNWMARWYRPDGPRSAAWIAESYARTILSGIAAH